LDFERDQIIDTRKSSGIIVREIMSTPVITAGPNSSIKELAKKMKDHDVDTIIIINKENEPLGVVTEGDIVRRLLSKKRSLWFTQAKHVMSKPVYTITDEAEIEDVAKYMVAKKVKRLCVVDENNKVIGVVTQSDILENTNYLLGFLKELLEANSGELAEFTK